MNKILAAAVLSLGLLTATTPVFAQEEECLTRVIIETNLAAANVQATSYFEDEDTVVYQSPVLPTLLEIEFNAEGCAVSFVEMDSVAANLKYGEGV